MKREVSVSSKCCATCIFWNGKAKYHPGFFGDKVEFDDSEKAKCNKRSGFFSTMNCKGTEGGGLFLSCSDWKQRF